MNAILLFHAFVEQTEQAKLDSPHNLPPRASQNHISSKKYLKFLVETKKSLNFAPQKRKVGRVIECAGLEIRYTHCGYRGFESLTFRERKENLGGSLFFVAMYAICHSIGIVYLHGEHRLSCQMVMQEAMVISKVNALFVPCLILLLEDNTD